MDGSLTLRDRRNIAAGVSNIYLQGLTSKAAEYFRDGDYKNSLKYLNDVVKQDAEAPISVLDQRACTFLKLGDFDKASSDAAAVIRRDRRDATGYLRLGQILQTQRKPEKALRVYEKGLREVPVDVTRYKGLKHACSSLAVTLAPKGRLDPMSLFPQELVTIIYENLTFRDIVNTCKVCKSWHQAVTSNASLWSVLDFSAAKKKYSLDTVRTYVKRSRGQARRFVTGGFYQDKALFHVAGRCKKLQELHYAPSPAGTTLFRAVSAIQDLRKLTLTPACTITLDLCIDILQSCERLEHVEFLHVLKMEVHNDPSRLRELTNLRWIALDSPSQHQSRLAINILPKLTHAHHLSMKRWRFDGDYCRQHGFKQLENLRYLDIAGSYSDHLPPFPTSIEDLSISNNAILASQKPFQTLPNLTRLSWADSAVLEDAAQVLQSWLNENDGILQELYLDSNNLTASELLALFESGRLRNVRRLSLRQCQFNDTLAKKLTQHLRHVQVFDMTGTSVTGIAVKEIVTRRGSGLQKLVIDSCHHVGIDAVEWARDQGVNVSFKFPESTKKGRKVNLI